MTNIEDLEQEAANGGVSVDRVSFHSDRLKGLYIDGNIAISSALKTSAEQVSVFAEELGHHYTSCGCILSTTEPACRHQELIARQWAYDRLVGLDGIIQAYKRNCTNIFEMSEELGVTESFLREALDRYRAKYGRAVQFGDYVIFFVPSLAVVRFIGDHVPDISVGEIRRSL